MSCYNRSYDVNYDLPPKIDDKLRYYKLPQTQWDWGFPLYVSNDDPKYVSNSQLRYAPGK